MALHCNRTERRCLRAQVSDGLGWAHAPAIVTKTYER